MKWYRYEHHNRRTKFLTPHKVHEGKGEAVLARRYKLYETAKAKHPERWNGRKARDWSMFTEVSLNLENIAFSKAETQEINQASSNRILHKEAEQAGRSMLLLLKTSVRGRASVKHGLQLVRKFPAYTGRADEEAQHEFYLLLPRRLGQ